MENIFCEQCRDFVEIEIRESIKETFARGKNITHKVKTAYCRNCFNEVYVADVNDYNINSLYEEIRKIEDLITSEQINNILEEYNIDAEHLSLLLGWEEISVSRYVNGDIMTKERSDALKDIIGNGIELNPEKIVEELIKNNIDSSMKFLGKEYLNMTRTVVEMFDYYGYEVKIIKKKSK